jgi:hypothetical protein
MPNIDQIRFNSSAVRPVECIKAGWETVKNQYWLFFGMCLLGLIIGSAVPLGILMGPMMCGLYLAFFNTRRGQRIEFGTLFKGFDFFGQSVVAAILHTVPIIAIVVPVYLLFYLGFFVMIAAAGNDPNPAAFFVFIFIMIIVWAVLMLGILVISILFMFTYPLIVDRGLQGLDAVKLSFRAARANFLGLLGLVLLNGLLGIAGLLVLIVGAYLVLPISYAAGAAAYEQVFGLRNPEEPITDLPPAPPTFQ